MVWKKKQQKNQGNIDTTNTHIHDPSLSSFGAGISTKSVGVKLVLMAKNLSLSEREKNNYTILSYINNTYLYIEEVQSPLTPRSEFSCEIYYYFKVTNRKNLVRKKN